MSIQLSDILDPTFAHIDVDVGSKKKLFEFLAHHAQQAVSSCSSDEIYERLLNRERLGSTGFGHGVAIPHCRLLHCHQVFGILVRLTQPIGFDAIDGQKVDLIFALFVPEDATEEHLKVLASLAERFNKEEFRQQLRLADSVQRLHQVAVNTELGN